MLRDKLAQSIARNEERRRLDDERFYGLMRLVVYGVLVVFGSIFGVLVWLLMR